MTWNHYAQLKHLPRETEADLVAAELAERTLSGTNVYTRSMVELLEDHSPFHCTDSAPVIDSPSVIFPAGSVTIEVL